MFAENASFLGLLCALGQGVAVAVHAALQNASQLLTYRPRSASPPPPQGYMKPPQCKAGTHGLPPLASTYQALST